MGSRNERTNARTSRTNATTSNDQTAKTERLDVQNIDMVYEMLKPLSPQRIRNIIKEENSLLKIERVKVMEGIYVNVITPESVNAYIAARESGQVTTRNGMSNVVAMVVWVPLDRDATTSDDNVTGEKIPTADAIAWLDASGYKYKPRDKARKDDDDNDQTSNDDNDDDAQA